MDKKFDGHVMDKTFDVITFRRRRVANFTDNMKIAIFVIKKSFKNSKIVKIIRNYVLKCNLYLYFLIKQKLSQNFFR